MGKSKSSNFHIFMFPWFAFGHMTPFLHLANKLAEKGFRITYAMPRKAVHQLQPLNLHPDLISLHPVTVPHVTGLPPGAETASDIPIFLTHFLSIAMDLTRDDVEALIPSIKPKLIIYDNAHWIPEIAKPLGIKTICYNVVCAASIAIILVPARNIPKDRPVTEEDLAEPPPGYPSSTVLLRGPEVQSLLFVTNPFGEGITFHERITMSMQKCDALSIRTCHEIEGKLCDYIGSQYGKQVLLTGPGLPEENKNPLEERWENWLAQFEPGSVIYCCFGSQFILEKRQFQELLLGFELTGLPFFVALKPPLGAATIEEAFPKGFVERTKERGLVLDEWVQQPQILAHPSVGCIVSHCGFGSMWESFLSHCQIVLIPQLGDQILNTRLLADELKIAVEVKRAENGWIAKQNLSEAIKSVMDQDSEFGKMLKENHNKWRDTICPELMTDYMDKFVQSIHELVEC
ncbi:UDP-glucuronosyl/UDP-glucosyltransferase [Corchorus capsularis]|uniref:UDP-glucuronosyl/UDP-glucosyltransferase n=1 Tax=Corchorus capsularis TaxID=210143 RepID=A0A1R3HX31_COCAP|nr:UDP-glucuronosyl/UDP-glucosyltransferase [Corchorus capsularis]